MFQRIGVWYNFDHCIDLLGFVLGKYEIKANIPEMARTETPIAGEVFDINLSPLCQDVVLEFPTLETVTLNVLDCLGPEWLIVPVFVAIST